MSRDARPPSRRLPMTLSGPIRRAAITNLGCKVNQAEMDAVERLLRRRGVELVDDHEPADLYVVNTCTVTSIADQKSRQAVRRVRRIAAEAEVLVTGCSVQVSGQAIAAADPAARLFDNEAKDRLLAELEGLLRPADGRPLPTLSGVEPASEPMPTAGRSAEPIDGVVDERTAIERTRAYIKVQDGCSFYCTYCIIPRARGPERSVEPAAALADVRRALAAGHREIVLTGINIGTYDGGASERGPRGSHRWQLLSLAGLVRRILAETPVERVRLSSIEPQHVTEELLEVWADAAGRCLPHFHLPLQSGDDAVLRRMGRRYDADSYARLVARLRQAIPGVAIHADVIVGFPGEDEAAWRRTKAFLAEIEPAGVHVFRYSARPGTPAVRMAGQVDERVKRERSAELLAVAAAARSRFAARQLGGELRVLFESALPDGRWLGHAENHVLVAARSPGGEALENAIGVVRAERLDPDASDRLDGSLLALDAARPPRALQVAGVVPSLSSPARAAPGRGTVARRAPRSHDSEGARHGL